MARTVGVLRRPRPRVIFVKSLPIQNPTSAAEHGGADKSFAVGHEATAGAPRRPRRTRRRRRRVAVAPLFDRVAVAPLGLPEEIMVWEIFVRLAAKDILRCRSVCLSWRGLTSAPDFLLAHHQRQPSLPLVALYGVHGILPIFERGRPVLGFDDGEDFKVHSSCDGLLLLSLSDGSFSICNPATRQCAPLAGLTAAKHIDFAVLYPHHPSGEYRVLYSEKRQPYQIKSAAYYILMVQQRGSSRCVGVPSDTHAMEEATSAGTHGMAPHNLAPPILFRRCLHWEPDRFYHRNPVIVVFDTMVESFKFMRRPADVTTFCTQMCHIEGSIGLGSFADGKTALKIWVLEDYEREVWSLKYHVTFPVTSLCDLANTKHLVLSPKGDVLVYNMSKYHMFHCDNTGKLIEEFRLESESRGLSIIGHSFKESLVKHEFFPRRAVPNIFGRL